MSKTLVASKQKLISVILLMVLGLALFTASTPPKSVEAAPDPALNQYARDLSNWANERVRGTRLVSVTIATNDIDGIVMEYRGKVRTPIKNFLGRPNEWLITSDGTVSLGGVKRNAHYNWTTTNKAEMASLTIDKPAPIAPPPGVIWVFPSFPNKIELTNMKLVQRNGATAVISAEGKGDDGKIRHFVISYQVQFLPYL